MNEVEAVNDTVETDEVIEYKYVLGQDPGDTTGVAMLRYTDNTPPELIYLHQIPDGREGFFYFFIGTEVGEGTEVTSVSEKWVTREGVRGAKITPAYIEGIQDAIWGFQTEYQPPNVKPIIGDEFLKVNNLWTEGKRHQMDALLHALYWLRSQGHEPTLKALSGESAEPLAQPGEADEKTLPQPGDQVGEGGEGGQPGDGEPMGAAEALAQMIAKAAQYGEGEPTGDGHGGGEGFDGELPEVEVDTTPKRQLRLNGGFMGFDDDEDL